MSSVVISQRNGPSLDTGQGTLLGADTGISFHVLFVYVLIDLYKRYLGYCSLFSICSFYLYSKYDHGIFEWDILGKEKPFSSLQGVPKKTVISV